MANVYAVIEDLENSKANARKKAVDALPTLLDEPAKRNQLSDASWVGLVKKSIESAKLEVLAAKKARRAPDFVGRAGKTQSALRRVLGRVSEEEHRKRQVGSDRREEGEKSAETRGRRPGGAHHVVVRGRPVRT